MVNLLAGCLLLFWFVGLLRKRCGGFGGVLCVVSIGWFYEWLILFVINSVVHGLYMVMFAFYTWLILYLITCCMCCMVDVVLTNGLLWFWVSVWFVLLVLLHEFGFCVTVVWVFSLGFWVIRLVCFV